MAIPNPTKSRTWDLGTSANGTIFDTEFNRLYANDNDLDGRVETLELGNEPFEEYTPATGSDLGTVSAVSAYCLRLGRSLFIYGSFALGTAGGGTDVWIGLPSGLTLATAKLISRKSKLGELTRLVSSRTSIISTLNSHLTYDSGLSLSSSKLRICAYTQSGSYDIDAASSIFNSNDVVNFVAGPLPITEWET